MSCSNIPTTGAGGSEVATQFPPIASVSAVGFTRFSSPQIYYTEEERAQMAKIAAQVLKSPTLMHQLCDRIFDLLRDDLKIQQDRSQHIGRYF